MTATHTKYIVRHTLITESEVDLDNLPEGDYLGLYDDEILKRIAAATLRYEIDCATGKGLKNICEHIKEKIASREALTTPSYWSGMLLGVLGVDEDEFMNATRKMAKRGWRRLKRFHTAEGQAVKRGRPRKTPLEPIEKGNG